MNKPLAYKILYYICFILTTFIWISVSSLVNEIGVILGTGRNTILGLINLILIIIFSIKLFKHKLDKINILFPIIYLLFLIIVVVVAILMNDKLIIPYIHYSYYISYILINYLLLNIYSVLSFKK